MLQEMDASWFAEHWEPVMATRGYEGHFTKKRHPGSSEGLATFVRTAAFEVVEARPLALSLAADDQAPAALSPLLATHESTAEGMSKLPSDQDGSGSHQCQHHHQFHLHQRSIGGGWRRWLWRRRAHLRR